MKLYATTTSERASKGQGGEYLDIEIKNDDRIVFATIKVRGQKIEIWHDGGTEVLVYKDSAWNREIYDSPYQKAKKQTGEQFTCEVCGKDIPIMRDEHGGIISETCRECKN